MRGLLPTLVTTPGFRSLRSTTPAIIAPTITCLRACAPLREHFSQRANKALKQQSRRLVSCQRLCFRPPHVPPSMRAPHTRWAVETDGEWRGLLLSSPSRHRKPAVRPRRFYGIVMCKTKHSTLAASWASEAWRHFMPAPPAHSPGGFGGSSIGGGVGGSTGGGVGSFTSDDGVLSMFSSRRAANASHAVAIASSSRLALRFLKFAASCAHFLAFSRYRLTNSVTRQIPTAAPPQNE